LTQRPIEDGRCGLSKLPEYTTSVEGAVLVRERAG
jgi:hypothetical protein